EQSKAQPFARVLFALGIRHVGVSIAELLASSFGDVERLQAASEEETSSIQGIGPEIAASVRQYFEGEENRRLIRRLKTAGLQFKAPRTAGAREGPLSGKSFVLTGILPTLSRKEAADLVERHGGKVVASVSSRTDYLLVGADPGTKLQKAKKLGVAQVTEEQLKRMIGE
ncbi:MAG: helix-hairpin-helix domain-containing protein, partial [Acidobacteriota bacterium]